MYSKMGIPKYMPQNTHSVAGFNPSEKYESQLRLLYHAWTKSDFHLEPDQHQQGPKPVNGDINLGDVRT